MLENISRECYLQGYVADHRTTDFSPSSHFKKEIKSVVVTSWYHRAFCKDMLWVNEYSTAFLKFVLGLFIVVLANDGSSKDNCFSIR